MTTTGIKIREAEKDELSRFMRLSAEDLMEELQGFERGDPKAARKVFARRTEAILKREGNEFFVAEVEGTPGAAGYVWLGVSDRPFSETRVGWVYDIRVLPGHRGKGVGEALLRHAMEVSRKKGLPLMGLMVKADNKVAYSLYEKLGFRPDYILMAREGSPSAPASNS